ncbi:ANTAR domain-containing protein [uncultured Nocardioides sp.]|uniref:ANTAR domain-containing protein n=1 Tax=uncultured Nocardioides sp. TaxID=198441 RepID=UPI002601F78D|nr:ANTAR domain-containing protein [uncultured Nocardioides sp.]
MTPVLPIELLAETSQALAQLALTGDPAHSGWLTRTLGRADDVRRLVPDLIGLSVVGVRTVGSSAVVASLVRTHTVLAFTAVACDEDIAALESVHATPIQVGSEVTPDPARAASTDPEDVLDELRWRRLAHATAATAVRSTLTLPILGTDGLVHWSITLYAGGTRAFDDVHDELADVFGAFAGGAVSNADLSFQTRVEARRTPELLREHVTVDRAVGILAAAMDISPETATVYLEVAASHDGKTVQDTAATIVEAHLRPDTDKPGESPRGS